MYKSAALLCLVCCVVIEARPKWQFLPSVPGYVPVYIQSGDTPLDQINPELAEAFHVLPAGRSASKQIEASSDEQPEPVAAEPAEPAEPVEPLVESEEPAVEAEEPVLKSIEAEEPVVETAEPKEISEGSVDHRPYAKKILEKKKKVSSEIAKPERR